MACTAQRGPRPNEPWPEELDGPSQLLLSPRSFRHAERTFRMTLWLGSAPLSSAGRINRRADVARRRRPGSPWTAGRYRYDLGRLYRLRPPV